MPNNVMHCTKPEMVPKGDHWAIVEFTTVTHGSDQDYDVKHIQTYTAYTNKDEWEAAVQDKTVSRYGNQFVALKVTRATIETKVIVR